MESLKQLQEMKTALDRQIAEAIEAERQRQRAIEEQQERIRTAEIEKIRSDVLVLMRKYDLSKEELLGDPKPASSKSLSKMVRFTKSAEQTKSLRDIRSYYANNPNAIKF